MAPAARRLTVMGKTPTAPSERARSPPVGFVVAVAYASRPQTASKDVTSACSSAEPGSAARKHARSSPSRAPSAKMGASS